MKKYTREELERMTPEELKKVEDEFWMEFFKPMTNMLAKRIKDYKKKRESQ